MHDQTNELDEQIRSSIRAEVDRWEPDLQRARAEIGDKLDDAGRFAYSPFRNSPGLANRAAPALTAVATAALVALVMGLTPVLGIRHHAIDSAAIDPSLEREPAATWCETGDANVAWDSSIGQRRYGALPEDEQFPVSVAWPGVARVKCLIGHSWTGRSQVLADGKHVAPTLNLKLKCGVHRLAGVKILSTQSADKLRLEVGQPHAASKSRVWYWSPAFDRGTKRVNDMQFGYESTLNYQAIDGNVDAGGLVPVYFLGMCEEEDKYVSVSVRVKSALAR